MGVFSKFIEKKFISIAGRRYEEILKSYMEFLLTEEESKIPEIKSILLPLDRYSMDVPESVFSALELFRGARLSLIYIIEENIVRLITETLGEDEACEYIKKEEIAGEKLLNVLSERLRETGFNVEVDIKRGEGIEIVGDLSKEFNLVFISKHFGSEPTKTHPISPPVFSLLQTVEKPLVLYR